MWWADGDDYFRKVETPPLEWGESYPPIPLSDAGYPEDSEE
jgi:hypothetical protein